MISVDNHDESSLKFTVLLNAVPYFFREVHSEAVREPLRVRCESPACVGI